MPKPRIAVLVSGSGSNLQALIDAVAGGKISGSIQMVISDRVGAFALQRAAKHEIPSICIDRKAADFADRLVEQLDTISPDLIVLAGFLSILPAALIHKFRNRIINIHPSLIPAFCGKGFYGERVHRAVIECGAKVSGATAHFVDEGTDTGPIILQQPVEVLAEDTAETLAARVLTVEHQLIVKAVSLFCDSRLKVQGHKVIIL